MKYFRMSLILLIFCSVIHWGYAYEKSRDPLQKLDVVQIEKIIQEIAEKVEEKYVFPDTGKEIAEYIRKRLKEKAYDHITTLKEFIQILNQHCTQQLYYSTFSKPLSYLFRLSIIK